MLEMLDKLEKKYRSVSHRSLHYGFMLILSTVDFPNSKTAGIWLQFLNYKMKKLDQMNVKSLSALTLSDG